jgi:hypothetical protein
MNGITPDLLWHTLVENAVWSYPTETTVSQLRELSAGFAVCVREHHEQILSILALARQVEANPTTVGVQTLMGAQSEEIASRVRENTWRGDVQQPYSVVLGVLVAWPPVETSVRGMTMRPPRIARLCVIPNRFTRWAYDCFGSVDLTECNSLSTVGLGLNHLPITSLKLPEHARGLRSIAQSAFKTSSMTELDLKGCIALEKIEVCAFDEAILTTLDLTGCIALESIQPLAFHKALLTTLDLSHCTALDTIYGRAFQHSVLTTLDISGCVALIEIFPFAFHSSKLTTLNLEGCKALTSIHRDTFTNSPLVSLNLKGCSALSWVGHRAFSEALLTTLDFSDCPFVGIGEEAFKKSPVIRLDLRMGVHSYSFFGLRGNRLRGNSFRSSQIQELRGPDDLPSHGASFYLDPDLYTT